MDAGKLYETAKNFAAKIYEEKPNYVAELKSAIALIVGTDDEIYNGTSGLKIADGNVTVIAAEKNAVIDMLKADCIKAKTVIVVDCATGDILQPTKECLEMLIEADESNENCTVVISADEVRNIKELLTENTSSDSEESVEESQESEQEDEADENIGSEESHEDIVEDDESAIEDDDESAVDILSDLGAPAEFSEGVVIDESNPFYEPPKEKVEEESEIKVLYNEPGAELESDDDDDDDDSNKEKTTEQMLKDAKKKKKTAKKFNSFFKRGKK